MHAEYKSCQHSEKSAIKFFFRAIWWSNNFIKNFSFNCVPNQFQPNHLAIICSCAFFGATNGVWQTTTKIHWYKKPNICKNQCNLFVIECKLDVDARIASIQPAMMTVEKEPRILRSVLSCCPNHTIAIFMQISSVKWILHVNRNLNWKRRISVLHFAQVPAAKKKSFHHHKQKEQQSGFLCTLYFMSENVRVTGSDQPQNHPPPLTIR